MQILQINVTCNKGSTGRISENIGKLVISRGGTSAIAYGRESNASDLVTYKIGNSISILNHVLITRLLDLHGLGSYFATKKLIRWINTYSPDIIHLHNIHGYYLNFPILFKYLADKNIPIVWTLHDCWSFTGHCSHFTTAKCDKWKTGCMGVCPLKHNYPASYFFSFADYLYSLKRHYFNLPSKVFIVSVSKWLDDFLSDSILEGHNHRVIRNGISLSNFSPTTFAEEHCFPYKLGDLFHDDNTCHKPIILGVASCWTKNKGLNDFISLHTKVKDTHRIVLLGLSDKQIKELPEGVIGIRRTENIHQLSSIYSLATVLFNPTYEDNYPTVNLEATACGTPVVTYRTGGSPESIFEGQNGFIVDQGDLEAAYNAIMLTTIKGKAFWENQCRSIAEKYFDEKKCFQEYLDLYDYILTCMK